MTLFQAFLLGLIQGFTEFLPVSSSGHLVIAQTFMEITQPPLIFDVLVHVGTLIAVIIFFSKRLLKLDLKWLRYLSLGTLPAFIVGILVKPYLQNIFTSLTVVIIGLYLTGFWLLSLNLTKKNSKTSNLNNSKAGIIGMFQAMAILPGISRSGSTVVGGLHLGLTKADAFFFSFLLSIPAILGAQVLQLTEITNWALLFNPTNLVGFTSAASSGLLALRFLQILINKTKLHLFGYYCLFIASLLTILIH